MTQEKREAILGAALAVFGERGFHGASVPEIAKRAGVGAGTIYRYFNNKEDLGNVLYREWKLRYVEQVLSGIPREGPWRMRFRKMWQDMLAFTQAHPGVLEYLEFHHHSSYLDDESRALSARFAGGLLSLIEEGQAEEVFVETPAPILIHMVYGAFLRLVRVQSAGNLTLTPALFAEAEERAWQMIRR